MPTRKNRELFLLTILLIGLSFCLIVIAEILMPFKEAIEYDVIRQGQRVFRERGKIKENDMINFKLKQEIESKIAKLQEAQINQATKNDAAYYAVVDLFNNVLFLKKGNRIINEFIISSGSGDTLIAPWGRKWVFDTPKGVLRILRKIKDPVWYKPDWAFIEVKESIPSANSYRRIVRGILGAYALDLGGGIMIHGTPHEDLLGRRVSHGCIRLPKEGIGILYDSLSLGAKIYIYGK
ncbi:MAG: L,D-transpeptidase [candidate division WOR-3 bacterium]|nr:L,D-transpeptidase [candidate division WOR-3 bacterium]